jgi:hypothetical protein
VRHVAVAIAVLAALALASCERLNPQWCAAARCGVGQYCDPETNSCRAREGGAADGQPDLSIHDGPQHADGGRDSRREGPSKDAANPCAMTIKGWSCSGGAAGTCGDAGFHGQRACPLAQCAYGHCQTPATITLCKTSKDCSGAWLCTLLLDAGGVPTRMCAAPVGGSPTPSACSSGLDCQSGLCSSMGQCYTACDVDFDCSTDPCKPTPLLVEGVAVTVKTCTP